MVNNSEDIARIATGVSYVASAGLVIGDILKFLNMNAAGFGVILGLLTFLTNLVFKYLNHRLIKSKLIIERRLIDE
jgi:hypothetical protein